MECEINEMKWEKWNAPSLWVGWSLVKAHSCWRFLLQCTPKCWCNFNIQWGKFQKPHAHMIKGN